MRRRPTGQGRLTRRVPPVQRQVNAKSSERGDPEVALRFPAAEYQQRLGKIRGEMERVGAEVLLVADPANMNYLSGYDGWSFYVPQVLVVLGSEPAPFWMGRPQDTSGARLTTWLPDDHIRSYPESFIQSLDHHPMEAVADLLRELGADHSRIGIELDAYYFTAQAYLALLRALPASTLLDASLLVNCVRLTKSPAELAYMRQAASIAQHAMATAFEVIEPGVRECDAAAAIFAAEIGGTADVPGDYPAIVPLMPSLERTTTSHLTWTDRCYEVGDVVNLELAGCSHRYHAPLARTLYLGTPPPAYRDLADVVLEGVEAALATIAPGAACEEVEAAWRRRLQAGGYEKASRLGYAVGIGYPPDWGEHTASLRAGDRTVLQPGMTFHLIAGMWAPPMGLELSETLAVTEAGCEVLTTFTRDLLTKDRFPTGRPA